MRGQEEIGKVRSQVESQREFIQSLKKDVLKLIKQVDKKQAEYQSEEEALSQPG